MQDRNIIYAAVKMMMDLRYKRAQGFSLMEMLLVLAIMATIIVAILGYSTQKSDEMRRDRTVMQIEQFLNAGLAYYVSFGSWPTLAKLQGNFLPSGIIKNSWGQTFFVGTNTTGTSPGSLFSVCTTIIGQQAYAAAMVIAGRLPMASAVSGTYSSCPPSPPPPPPSGPPESIQPCQPKSDSCTVVSSVNIPGQNLNNARSINFAGLYHNGACVAAPSCPLNMVPMIVVTPVSVSGMNDRKDINTNSNTIYPISSFTAYAIGKTATSPSSPDAAPLDCNGVSSVSCGLPNSSKYWRVCLRIFTQKGLLTSANNPDWGKDAGIILALTRCMPAAEPTTPEISGSTFTVFTSDSA